MCRNTINTGLSRRQFLGASAALALPQIKGGASAASLEDGFANVPNASRMRMHWYVFGPAWTAAEAERELRLMAEAHIGGVLLFPAYPIALDDPARGIRNTNYLSQDYLDVLRSAAEAGGRAGLTMDTVLGTGWPYGGPSVTLDDSAHAIQVMQLSPGTVWDKTPLDAGQKPVAAFASEAGQFRMLRPGETFVGETRLFYSAPTRMQVKRASLGAEGLIIDHYNPDALARFLHAVGDKVLGAAPSGSIRSVFSDSLEVYRATWTERFPAIFLARRGYDIVPHLAALFADRHPDARDVRRDFWGVLSELAGEAYVRPLGEWAHAHGVTTQVEAYGTPPVNISSYRYVDVPVGEHYEWKEFNSSRWASSGGHLAGKPVILAEAWTWLGLPNRFADTLEELKLCSDLHFLSGINALYGLTYAYSPADVPSPGWLPYFGPAINHTTPFWPYFRYLADYVNRASYVLQRGKPVADVAVYLPVEDAMADAAPEQLLLNWAVRDRLSSNGPPPEFSLRNALHYESDVVKGIVTNGYSFDGIDTHTLNGGMLCDGGRLRMGDGNYQVLVLPNLTGIDLESAEKIEAFVHGGGTVIATRRLPNRSWGWQDREQRTSRVRELIGRVFGSLAHGTAYQEHPYGAGVAVFCADEQGSFRRALERLQPDIKFTRPSEHVSFVHRRDEDRDYYFIVNTSEEVQALDATFRVANRVPELWNLHTGAVEEVVAFEPSRSGLELRFPLGPRDSKLFVFRDGARPPAATITDLELTSHGARVFENGTYYLESGAGRREIPVSGIPAPYVLSLRWRLTMGSSRLELNGLNSWTEMPQQRYFSGRGVYEAEFHAPPFEGLGVVLDLGEVRETADVRVNGQPAGVAWMRPYQLDITALLTPGRNEIRIDVTNLLINQILGMGPIDYSKVYEKYGDRFPPGDEWTVIRDPLPSGLLGPVRLVFYKLVKP